MEDHASLLGKTKNSALYWLLHPIDTLLQVMVGPRCSRCVCYVTWVSIVFVCYIMAWTFERCKTPAMEHREGLLGKRMHNALYWELHPIGESHMYRLLLVRISMFWWVPRHCRLSWQNLNRWARQLIWVSVICCQRPKLDVLVCSRLIGFGPRLGLRAKIDTLLWVVLDFGKKWASTNCKCTYGLNLHFSIVNCETCLSARGPKQIRQNLKRK